LKPAAIAAAAAQHRKRNPTRMHWVLRVEAIGSGVALRRLRLQRVSN
jgi:hypothetical protein